MPLLTLQSLLLRIKSPSRAQEHSELKARFSALSPAPREEQRLAKELLTLKRTLSEQLRGSGSCATCNQKHPRPEGPWTGGYCCSAPTTNLFDDDEIASLAAAGVTPAQLTPPLEPQHGCLFRGELGCSLRPEQRPTICVRYLCVTLELELARAGQLTPIEATSKRLSETFEALAKLRAKRLEEEEFAALLAER